MTSDDIFFEETYKKNYTNTAAINAASLLIINDVTDIKNARINNNMPHNAAIVTNQSVTCTLFIFLDDWSDLTKPDYILLPTQQIAISPKEDGIKFTTLAVYNTHAATAVAINELKTRIMTLKPKKLRF